MAFVSLKDSDRLVWRQASLFGRAIEITSGGQLAGILRLQGWASHCDATCADGMWHFQRDGFLRRRVEISELQTGGSVGLLQPGIGTRLILADGTTFRWKRISFWRQEMAFLTESEFTVVVFEPKRFSFRDAGTISVKPEYKHLEELPLLIMLGSYLTLLVHRRSQTA